MTHRVGPKGQVVIPKHYRDRLGLRPGTSVGFRLRPEDGVLEIVPTWADPIDDGPAAIQRLARGKARSSASDELLALRSEDDRLWLEQLGGLRRKR